MCFDNACLKAFEYLKKKLISTPFILYLDWSILFEIMCGASSVELGAVLGQRRKGILHPIY